MGSLNVLLPLESGFWSVLNLAAVMLFVHMAKITLHPAIYLEKQLAHEVEKCLTQCLH